jgi:hypothetical protein
MRKAEFYHFTRLYRPSIVCLRKPPYAKKVRARLFSVGEVRRGKALPRKPSAVLIHVYDEACHDIS